MTHESKPIWKSKTFWFNLVSLLIAIVGVIADSDLLTAKTIAVITTTVIPIGNLILRVLTNEPVRLS